MSDAEAEPLRLYDRVESTTRTVQYYYCSKCGREARFSWQGASCTETGELLCLRLHTAR